MKHKLSLFSLSIASLAIMLSAFAMNKNNYVKTSADDTVDAEILSVQVRSEGSGSINNYVVIQDGTFDPTADESTIDGAAFNAPSHIKVHMSYSEPAIYLSDIIDSSRQWTFNKWASGGTIMFPISADTYKAYNACSILALEIMEGCEYPNNKGEKVVVQEARKFYNNNYLNPAYTAQTFDWTEYTPLENSTDTFSLAGAQVRADSETSEYYICINSESYYADETAPDRYPKCRYPDVSTINAFSKIKIYLDNSDEYHTLGQIASLRVAIQNRWDSCAIHFALTKNEYKQYNGSSIYKIVIEQGCQLVVNSKVMIVDRDYAFINNDYQVASCRNGAFRFVEIEEKTISLYGAQIRGDKDDGLFYIDLQSESLYINDDPGEIVYDDLSRINAYDRIRVYTSKNDSGKLLSEICSLREGVQNRWDSKALLFALTEEEFEIYNGSSVYLVEVLEGCQLYNRGTVYTVDKGYRFMNPQYGDEGEKAKYESLFLSPEVKELVNLGEIAIKQTHNRMDMDSEYRWIMFLMDENIYDKTVLINHWIDRINFLDNVFVYYEKDGNPKCLRELFDRTTAGATIMQFGEKNMFGVSILNPKVGGDYTNNGPHMYGISILAGTQVPTYEEGIYGYRVVKDKTFIINNDYGKTGPTGETNPEDGMPRYYEYWNLNWSVVPCIVDFKVVGISGLFFKEMQLEQGQRVKLDMFAQEGYDLSARTSTGEKVYQCIVGVNRNITIILSYSPKTESINTIKNIDTTVILISSIIAGVFLVGAAVFIVVLSKKGRKTV